MGMKSNRTKEEGAPEIGWFIAFMTYLSYAIIILVKLFAFFMNPKISHLYIFSLVIVEILLES